MTVSTLRHEMILKDALLVPDDRLQAKDVPSDRDDAVVSIAVWRTPVFWKSAASRVVDELHRPTQLTENHLIAQGGHVWVRPCVNGDVIPVSLVRHGELIRICQDIHTDHEVRRADVVFFQERI